MLNIVNNFWLKNVNNGRINSSKTVVYSSPNQPSLLAIHTANWLKAIFSKLSNTPLFTYLYTQQNMIFNLLNKSFTHYPHSLLLELLN